MTKLRDKLDHKYTKVCMYASVTVIITAALLLILYYSGSFWGTLWSLTTSVLSPLVIGGIICYLLFPIVGAIEHKLSSHPGGRERVLAILICYLMISAILLALLIALFFAVNNGIRSIDFESLREFVISTSEKLMRDYHSVIKSLEETLESSITDFPVTAVTGALNALVASVTNAFSNMIFGIIFSIYIMIDWDNISAYWGHAFDVILGKKTGMSIKSFVRDADRVFSGYIRGQFIDAVIVGLVTGTVFTLTGIPYGGLVGVIVGVGNLIPYVGPVLGYISIGIVCLITGSWEKLILGILMLAVIMFLDGNILNPKLLSDNVKVHPMLVVVALIGGAAVSGFLGMVVAVPVAALIKLQFDRYLERKDAEHIGP